MIPVVAVVSNGGEKVPDHFTPLSSADVHCAALWLTVVHNGSQQFTIIYYGSLWCTWYLMAQKVLWYKKYGTLHRGFLWHTQENSMVHYGSLCYFIANTLFCKKFYGTHRATGCYTEVEFWYINCGTYY